MKIQLFSAEDWCGLYVDGKLHYEGHNIPDEVYVDLLKGDRVWDIPTYTGDNLAIWGGHCPTLWTEIERVIQDK